MSLSDRIAAAERAAIAAAAERALLTGEGTAATTGPGLEDLAEAHAQTVQIDRYLDAVEAVARESLARVERAFEADPSPEGLASINYIESMVLAVLTARRLLRTPDLLAAVATMENQPPTAEHPWRIAHGRLALHLIASGGWPGALERLADLLT